MEMVDAIREDYEKSKPEIMNAAREWLDKSNGNPGVRTVSIPFMDRFGLINSVIIPVVFEVSPDRERVIVGQPEKIKYFVGDDEAVDFGGGACLTDTLIEKTIDLGA